MKQTIVATESTTQPAFSRDGRTDWHALRGLSRKLWDGCRAEVLPVLSGIILLLGCGMIASVVRVIFVAYTPVPSWDEWFVLIRYTELFHKAPFRWIWEQNNEHRIVLQKLLFLLDFGLFHGSEWFMLASIFLIQVLLSVVVVWWLVRFAKLRGWSLAAALGLIFLCVFCPSQWENYTWGFQVSFVLVTLLFVTSLSALLLYAERSGPGYRPSLLVLSLLLACAATISNGNGVVAWPVLIGCTLTLKLSRRITLLYCLTCLLITALYMYGYVRPGHHASPLQSIRDPLKLLEYIEKYFGGSLLPGRHLEWAFQVGAIGLTLALICAARILHRTGPERKLFVTAMIAVLAYLGLTAFITSLGRINFGTDQAFASRYQSYALLFWLCIGLLIWTHLLNRQRHGACIAVLAFVTLLVAAIAPSYTVIVETVRGRKLVANFAGVAMLEKIHDEGILRGIWVLPSNMEPTVDYLRQHRLSFFAEKAARRLGTSFASVYHIAPGVQCQGYVDIEQPMPSNSHYKEILGWSTYGKSNLPVQGLVLVRDGIIVGYGVSGYPRGDVANAMHSQSSLYSGWNGLFPDNGSEHPTEVYGILPSWPKPKVCKVTEIH